MVVFGAGTAKRTLEGGDQEVYQLFGFSTGFNAFVTYPSTEEKEKRPIDKSGAAVLQIGAAIATTLFALL